MRDASLEVLRTMATTIITTARTPNRMHECTRFDNRPFHVHVWHKSGSKAVQLLERTNHSKKGICTGYLSVRHPCFAVRKPNLMPTFKGTATSCTKGYVVSDASYHVIIKGNRARVPLTHCRGAPKRSYNDYSGPRENKNFTFDQVVPVCHTGFQSFIPYG